MKAIVWSKVHCPMCDQSKKLLTLKGVEFEERRISNQFEDSHGSWTKEQLLEAVPTAKSVPQIFIDDQLIGGFKELQEYFANNG
jgi:glutaredoxin 3